MHVMARILPLKLRRNIALLKLMYTSLQSSPNMVNKGSTRSAGVRNFPIPFPRSELFRNSVAYQGKKMAGIAGFPKKVGEY